MSWPDLIEMIADEVGEAAAARIEERARELFGGQRITILQRMIITRERIDAVAPGRPKEAAKRFGVHPSTIYRHLSRKLIR